MRHSLLSPSPRDARWVEVATELRTGILRGDWAPGTHLKESELAKRFQVSRGPVRETIRVLVREGLVETRSNGRTIVRGMTPQDVSDLYRLRLAIESLAVTQATERASNQALEPLKRLVDGMKELAEPGREATRLDVGFHEALVVLSRNRPLQETWRGIAATVMGLLDVTNRYYSDFSHICGLHEEILAAVQRRDAAAATRALKEHLALGEATVAALYQDLTAREDSLA